MGKASFSAHTSSILLGQKKKKKKFKHYPILNPAPNLPSKASFSRKSRERIIQAFQLQIYCQKPAFPENGEGIIQALLIPAKCQLILVQIYRQKPAFPRKRWKFQAFKICGRIPAISREKCQDFFPALISAISREKCQDFFPALFILAYSCPNLPLAFFLEFSGIILEFYSRFILGLFWNFLACFCVGFQSGSCWNTIQIWNKCSKSGY